MAGFDATDDKTDAASFAAAAKILKPEEEVTLVPTLTLTPTLTPTLTLTLTRRGR